MSNGMLSRCCAGVSIVAIALGVTACSHQTASMQTPAIQMVSEFGNWQCLPDTWVKVDPSDRKMTLTYSRNTATYHLTKSLSTDELRAGPGWFVYVENHNRVWYYTGSFLQLLAVDDEGNTKVHGNNTDFVSNFPVKVPEAVSQRIKVGQL